MPPEAPITWGQVVMFLSALSVVIAALWVLWNSIAKATHEQTTALNAAVEASRLASEAGRARLYDKMAEGLKELRDSTVSKDAHAADLRILHHTDTELSQQLASLAQRLDGRCARVVVSGKGE